MNEILYHYDRPEPATWFYLSSLLMIGLFFKFGRFWSVRNLDLILLILLAPGLLFIHYGKQLESEQVAATSAVAKTNPNGVESAVIAEPDKLSTDGEAAEGGSTLSTGMKAQRFGFLWLFCTSVLWLARLLADPTMVRRPLLEPNLSAGGLTFIGCSLFVFLMANVLTRTAAEPAAIHAASIVSEQAANPSGETAREAREGPGYALMDKLSINTQKAMAIVAHLLIVLGMVLIGYWHFDNIVMGVGAATLYLMLPYTSLMTNEVKHVLPAASLVWAVLWYRKPMIAGLFLGLAGGMTYYPLFLLPLWLSFYWPRGLLRFVTGVVSVLVVLAFVLVSSDSVVGNLRLMFGILPPAMDGLGGVWDEMIGGWSGYWRIPVLTAFVALAVSMALWPAQKNLGTLLSCSAAVMVATQTWHGYGGGTYMAWYLPMVLLTIFRPNLEDRVALTVLAEGWLPRRISSSLPTDKAA
ncbi:MAG: hypothetical protein GY768_28180 [Planctomycetaceae bacterium]|nr:hypothetical protein [Planctomycetaceae bacterium]